MNNVFGFLNLAAILAGILSFFVGIYSLPSHKRRAACLFVSFFLLLLFVGSVILWRGSLALPDTRTLFSSRERLIKPTVEPARSNEATKSPAAHVTPPPPQVRLASIQALAYSRSKERWAGPWMGGQSYPDAHLVFSSGLVVAPYDISWHASYRFESDKLCLSISNLRVPNHVALMEDFYRDFEIGYAVELDNAVFADYTMARVIMLYRSFIGDTPQQQISKCFAIIPVRQQALTSTELHGKWEGQDFAGAAAEGQSSPTSFELRLLQKDNKLMGSMLVSSTNQSGQVERSRWEVEGWVLGDKVTFVKRNAKLSLVGISYVAAWDGKHRDLSGAWYGGFATGHWTLRFVGDSNGSPDDILSPQGSNPPERQ